MVLVRRRAVMLAVAGAVPHRRVLAGVVRRVPAIRHGGHYVRLRRRAGQHGRRGEALEGHRQQHKPQHQRSQDGFHAVILALRTAHWALPPD
jgi:hypothetical protein